VPDVHVSDETFDALEQLAQGGQVESIVAEAVENLLMQRLLASTLVELADATEPAAEFPRVVAKAGKPRLDVGGHQSYPIDRTDPKKALGLICHLSTRAGVTPKFLRDAITRIAAAFEWQIREWDR